MGAGLAGVALQQPVPAQALADRAGQGQQGHGEGAHQQQVVAPRGLADAGGRKLHAEPQALGVADLRLDGPAPCIVIDRHGGRRIRVAGGQTPRLLHALGMDAHHHAAPLFLGCYPSIAQPAGPAGLADPLGCGVDFAILGGDTSVATEADHVAGPQLGQEGEQFVVAEAAVGQDRHLGKLLFRVRITTAVTMDRPNLNRPQDNYCWKAGPSAKSPGPSTSTPPLSTAASIPPKLPIRPFDNTP